MIFKWKKAVGVIEKYLNDNVITSHSEHRFVKGKSYLSKLIFFYDKVTHLVDQWKPVDGIFLDICKAFCTVSHYILLNKMFRIQWSAGLVAAAAPHREQRSRSELFSLMTVIGPEGTA